MKNIYIIRHAESVGNAGGKVDSPDLIPLSEKGHLQARELAETLRVTPDLIITSPLLRAKDTALPFAKKHPAAPMETWEIEEFTYIDPKLYTEKDTDERIRIYKEYWQEADVHHRMADTTESFSMLIGRVKKFLEKLESREEQEIVVFSHGRFIHTLQLYIQKVKELGHENLTDEDLQHIKDTHRELAVFSKSLFPVDNVSIYTIQL